MNHNYFLRLKFDWATFRLWITKCSRRERSINSVLQSIPNVNTIHTRNSCNCVYIAIIAFFSRFFVRPYDIFILCALFVFFAIDLAE